MALKQYMVEMVKKRVVFFEIQRRTDLFPFFFRLVGKSEGGFIVIRAFFGKVDVVMANQ